MHAVKAFFATIFVFLVVSSIAVFFWASPKARRAAPTSSAESLAHQETALRELWPAPEFEFLDESGARVSKSSLTGHPWVANFVFTTCRSVCPLLTTKMVRLQRELPEMPVEFVSFSVDPANDSQAALRDYKEKWNADEKRWHLLQTTDEGVASFASGFKITAQKADGGPDAVFHSQVFVLVDEKGMVRGIYDLEDARDFRALVQGLRQLTQSPEKALARADRDGPTLYRELSCANCHDNPALAPALGGIFDSNRELDNALTVKADDEYLKEAILNPDAKRVKGYPLHMPSYAGHVTYVELENLLKHIKGFAPAQESPSAEVFVDPICQMEVRATPDALHIGDVYFCSAYCRDEYVKKGLR